ncbi:MAG: hypothetical protein ACNA7V_09245, partial [Bacteroidales bacterium]
EYMLSFANENFDLILVENHIYELFRLQLKTRFTDNENLKESEIIKSFNELTKQYQIESVQLKDFDKVVEREEDEFPF